ncbi:MAG: hypothetical protein IKQ97_11180 [Eubacterium sp.]|nr:hypothetical protein [Eubacterium sp.]
MLKRGFCENKFRSKLVSGTLTMSVAYVLLLSDSVVAGFFIGEKGVAAINAVSPVTGIVVFLSGIIASGSGILYSRKIGAMKKDEADKIFGQGLIVSAVIALLGSAFFLFGKDIYFNLMGIPNEIYELASAYYIWTPFNVILEVMLGYLATMVYIDGDDISSNLSNICQIVGNLLFSILLVQKLGMEGIILGTVIGNATSLIPTIWHFFRKSNSLHFSWHFSFSDLFHVIRYSVVDSAVYLCWGVADFIMIGFVSANYGETGLITLSVVFNLIEFNVVLDGVGQAVQPLLGTYMGEDNPVMIKRLMRSSFFSSLLEGLIAATLVFILAKPFCGLFGITEGTALEPSIHAVRIVAVGILFSGLLTLVTSYYMLIDHVALAVLITVLDNGILYSTLPMLGSILFGETGMWVSFMVTPIISLIISFIFVRLYYGKERFPFLLEKSDAEIVVMDDILTNDNITKLSERVSDLMLEQNYPEKVAMKAALFIEEIGVTIMDKNKKKNKKLYVEITMFFERSSLLLIERDSGIIIDLTDPDIMIEGLSGFILSGLMESHGEKAYLTTTGYNRNMIRFQKAE